MPLVCGLEPGEKLGASELGVDGPLEIPEVEEFLEVLWTDESEELSAELLLSAVGDCDGCSFSCRVAASKVKSVSTAPSIADGEVSATS